MAEIDENYKLQIGLLAPDKKFRNFFTDFSDFCTTGSPFCDISGVKSLSVTCIRLQFDDDGNPFHVLVDGTFVPEWPAVDVIIHKLTVDLALATHQATVGATVPSVFLESETVGAQRRLAVLEKFLAQHTNTFLYQPLHGAQKTTHRRLTQQVVEEAICNLSTQKTSCKVSTPLTVYIETFEKQNEFFSQALRSCHDDCWIIKPEVAVDSTGSGAHHLQVVRLSVEKGSKAAQDDDCLEKDESRGSVELLLQPSFPHNIQRLIEVDFVLKIYVIGDDWGIRIVENHIPIPPISTTTEDSIAFGAVFLSQDKKYNPPLLETIMNPSADSVKQMAMVRSSISTDVINTTKKIVDEVKRVTGISLFGVDILVGSDDVLYVIDLNYFPGYKGVPSVYEAVLSSAVSEWKHFRARRNK